MHDLVGLLEFYFTGKHKWDSFVSISIYLLPLSTVSIFGSPLIAPFWEDVDINMFGNIFYRQTSSPTLLQRVHNELQQLFPSSGSFSPTTLLIATWDRVAQFIGVSEVNNKCLLFTMYL